MNGYLAAINNITDIGVLKLLSSVNKAQPHLVNALQIKHFLLEPVLIERYGKLQLAYAYSKSEKKYGAICTLYVEHVKIEIIDNTGKVFLAYTFDGAPGQSQEQFKTQFGICTKTNEANVSITQVQNDLFKDIPTPSPTPIPTPVDSRYEIQQLNGELVIVDHLNKLMWQRSGSSKELNWRETQKHIEQLNQQQFAGYTDWRLPTGKELKTLLTSTAKQGSLYIDPVFDSLQTLCWAVDKGEDSLVIWSVNFLTGSFSRNAVEPEQITFLYYVRVVRSLDSDPAK